MQYTVITEKADLDMEALRRTYDSTSLRVLRCKPWKGGSAILVETDWLRAAVLFSMDVAGLPICSNVMGNLI